MLVDVKFNSYRIVPRYCDNTFALHLHTSIISALIFNTLNLAIHKNTRSMIISLTKICTSKYIEKISKKKITIHFIIFYYYKKFTQQYGHKIHCKSDAPPHSLKNSNVSPEVEIAEEKGGGVCSLICDTSKIEGRAKALGWGLG
jgi:hypothetical protein